MSVYLNPGNKSFEITINSEIYVDKSLLIEYTNKVINTNMQCLCFKTKTLWKEYRCKYASCILF
ncbi:hypothetical protein [Thomasclavelia cocleata]|jgi:hypothetical protein|uniref:hypothetical protein n=1 Tax=Thomasclavelia cocleata TaxID=69824 RepID=UPI00241F1405|nr:hypothetical protein [Thomasclavelia cocleata]